MGTWFRSITASAAALWQLWNVPGVSGTPCAFHRTTKSSSFFLSLEPSWKVFGHVLPTFLSINGRLTKHLWEPTRHNSHEVTVQARSEESSLSFICSCLFFFHFCIFSQFFHMIWHFDWSESDWRHLVALHKIAAHGWPSRGFQIVAFFVRHLVATFCYWILHSWMCVFSYDVLITQKEKWDTVHSQTGFGWLYLFAFTTFTYILENRSQMPVQCLLKFFKGEIVLRTVSIWRLYNIYPSWSGLGLTIKR